mmetsp:Transcript_79197/g.245623  ORF Transcript_79197/g.245623 Transcript_79197/m.245623 type:complete len:296 (+) Transcript_79197:92-979(+)
MGEFEWILDFAALQAYLDPRFLQVSPGLALVVGCGRSALSKELKTRGFFSEVVSVDSDAGVIEAMRSAEPSLNWICADCCSEEAMAAALRTASPALAAGGAFDAVIDKGTLDAVLCEDGKAAGLLAECYRALKPGGAYVCVSLRHRGLLDRLLGPGGPCDWAYETRTAPGPRGETYTVALLRRPPGGGEPPCPRALRAHCEEALDAFFAEAPLLTAERESALRAAFAAHLSRPDRPVAVASLPLEEAYTLLFTAAERSEYALRDFCEDAAASAHARADPARMSLEEALAFLRDNQ